MSKRVNSQILKLAIPNIISNITIPLLGIVDIALMGHLGNENYIGAIALGALIFNFIYWGFGFLRMGTTGFTAQAWGQRDLEESFHMLTRSLLIGVTGGIILIAAQKPIMLLGFEIINGDEVVESLASEYFRVRIWAAPATLCQYAILGWFIGMQNARFPMIVAIAANLLNVASSYFFVVYMGMNVQGVALGTVIAQYFGLILSLVLYQVYYRRLNIHRNIKKTLNLNALSRFMNVNKDIFIRTMCLVIVFSYFTARSASSDIKGNGDEMILAVNSLLMQFFMFFSFLIDGFAYAAEALTGKFIGGRSQSDLRRLVSLLFKWGAIAAVIFSLTYLLGGKVILRILTNNEPLISKALPYLLWTAIIPLAAFPAFLFDGIYIGATAGSAMRNSMLVSTLLVFFPLYLLLEGLIGNHALWLAFVLFLISRGATLFAMAPKHIYSGITR